MNKNFKILIFISFLLILTFGLYKIRVFMNLNNEKEKLIQSWKNLNIPENILKAFKEVKREDFVLPEYKHSTYNDIPLPIPAKQTISQPRTVVLMLKQLQIEPGQKILEIGTGSGFNAAMLSKLAGPNGKVISTEIIPELHEYAKKNLQKGDFKNLTILQIDGSKGYEKEAPYDRIIVTAAAPKIPQILIDQLKEGGIILIPTGEKGLQEMIRGTKIKNKLKTENLGPYAFVPLTGEYGQK